MESEVDTSILNSVNIKRFTESVLEEYGGDIDHSNSAKWSVTFPDELAAKLDREQGTLVFDAADRERGAGELLVQPGTTVFSALLDLVQQSGSVGRIRLTEESLQVNPPHVLQASDLDVEITDFHKQDSEFALAFHFRVRFETPSSFQNEEMITVTIDPDTHTRLPELTGRLTSHLPQLIQERTEPSPRELPTDKVQDAFREAQQAVIDRAEPIVAEMRGEAQASANERIDEIRDWYAQRRSELDEQLEEQRAEIRKWKQKRRKARKDSTRRRYIQNRKEAEAELEQLQQEINRKKQELDRDETDEIDTVLQRNEVEVDISLLGVTEITYVQGTLTLDIQSTNTATTTTVTYFPATDEFHGLNCEQCGQDLTDGVLPRLCENGHMVGDSCAVSCRTCDVTACTACDSDGDFTACEICWEDVCHDCIETCRECDSAICSDHSTECTACGQPTCQLCGETCATCGDFCCDSELTHCPDCDDYHCDSHLQTCDFCESPRCETHIGYCGECDKPVCSNHRDACTACDDGYCILHLDECTLCHESEQHPARFCAEDIIRCTVCEETVCASHRVQETLGDGAVCKTDVDTCSTCNVRYSINALHDGQCSACRSIGDVAVEHIPDELVDEFRTVEAGGNNAYLVVLGKKLLGRNQLVVYDIETGEESHRHSAGTMKQLLGKYK